MPYGVAHSLSYPVIGSDTGVVGATKVNTALAALAATLDAKVTPAGIDMAADLSFRSGPNYFGAKELNRVSFKEQLVASLPAASYPATAFVGTDGEFYFNDLAGNRVKITSAGSISAAAGNITGIGYGLSGKEVNWDDGNADYRMRSGSGTDDYADVVVGDVRFNDGSGHFARLGAASMAADLNFALPAVYPASKSILQMSTSGFMTAAPGDGIAVGDVISTGSATFAGTLGVTGGAGVGSLVTAGTINSGAITSSSTGTFAGLVNGLGGVFGASGVTSAGGFLASVNQNVTLSGTGKYKHGNRELVIPSAAFQNLTLDTTRTTFSGTYNHWHGSPTNPGTSNFFCGIGAYLPVGARIRSITVTYFGGGTANTRTARLESTNTATDSVTSVAAVSSTTDTGVVALAMVGVVSGTTAIDFTLVNTGDLNLLVDGLQQNDYLKSALVTYDEP